MNVTDDIFALLPTNTFQMPSASDSGPTSSVLGANYTPPPIPSTPPPPPPPAPTSIVMGSGFTPPPVQNTPAAPLSAPTSIVLGQNFSAPPVQPAAPPSYNEWDSAGPSSIVMGQQFTPPQVSAPPSYSEWDAAGPAASSGPTSLVMGANFTPPAVQTTPSYDEWQSAGDAFNNPFAGAPSSPGLFTPLTTNPSQIAANYNPTPGTYPWVQQNPEGGQSFLGALGTTGSGLLQTAGILGSAQQSYGPVGRAIANVPVIGPTLDLATSPLGLASVAASGGASLLGEGAGALLGGLGTGAAEDLAGSAGAIYAPRASNAALNATNAPGWLYGPVNTAAMVGGALAGGKIGQLGAEAAPGAARAVGRSLSEFPTLDVAAPVKPLSEADFVFPRTGAIDPATGQPFPMQDIAGGAASPEDQIAALKNAGYSDADIASLQGALAPEAPGPTLVQQARGLVQQYKQVTGKDAFSPADRQQLYQMAGRVAKGTATPEETAQVNGVMNTLQGVVDEAKATAAAAAKPRYRFGPEGLRQIDPVTGEPVPVEAPTPEGAIPETPASIPTPSPAPLPETPAPISQEGALSAAGAEGGAHSDEYAGLYRQLRDQGVTDAEARSYLGYDKNTPSPAYEGDGATVEANEPPRRKIPGGNGTTPPGRETPPPGETGPAPEGASSSTTSGQRRSPIDTVGDMMRQAAVVGHIGIVSLHGFTTMLTHPGEWAADVGSALKAAAKPEVADELRASRVAAYDAIQPGASDALKKAGLRVFGSNSGDLYKTPLNKIPVVGNIFERNDAFYNAATESFRDDAAQRMLKLQRSMNEAKTGDATITPKQFKQIADTANHLTGTTTRSMGTFANTLFWAPRLLTSEVAMVGDALTKGGAAGAVARRMVAQTAAEVFGGIIAYNMATSGGKNVWGPGYGLKDFPQAVKSGKLFSINVKGQTVRPLGLFYSPVQTAASLVADAIDRNPSAAEEDALYFMRDHLSPLISLALDIYTGKDYAGKPITLQGKITDSIPIIGQQGYDIAKEAQKGLWGQTVADVLNTVFNIHPKTQSAYAQRDAQVAQFLKQHPELAEPGATPQTYYDLSPRQKKAFDAQYGTPAPTTPGGQALADIDKERLSREAAAGQAFASGQMDAATFRDQISHISYATDQKRAQADSDLKIFQTTGKLPSDPNKAALAQYYAILDDPKNQLPDGELNYDAIDPKMQALSDSLTDAQRKYIDDNTNLTSHDPTVQAYKDTTKQANDLGWWDISTKAWQQVAAKVPALSQYTSYAEAQQKNPTLTRAVTSAYSDLLTAGRIPFIKAHPALVRNLVKYGLFTPNQTLSALLGQQP